MDAEAQRAMATVNFRVHPNNTVEDVIKHVKDVTSDIKGIEVTVSDGGISGSEDHKIRRQSVASDAWVSKPAGLAEQSQYGGSQRRDFQLARLCPDTLAQLARNRCSLWR